jgi:hypothetical protein
MAVGVETASGSVSVARFNDPQPSRTIGMIWRKTSPLAAQLLQLSDLIGRSADALRERHIRESSTRSRSKRPSGAISSLKSRGPNGAVETTRNDKTSASDRRNGRGIGHDT